MQDDDLAVDDTAVEEPELTEDEQETAELEAAYDKAQENSEDNEEDSPSPKEAREEAPEEFEEEEHSPNFEELPPEIQNILQEAGSELEAEYSRRTEELEQREQQLSPLSQVTEQWNPYLNQLGVDPATAINSLMQTEYTLRNGTPEQKRQALAYLNQSYGLEGADPQGDGYVDPEVQQLRNQLSQIQLNQQQFQHQQAQEAEQRELISIDEEISSFETQTTSEGALANPLFEFVQDEMAAFVQSGQADTLDEAYEMAIWANPDTRAELIAFQQEQEAAERTARAKEAKRHSNSNIRTRNQGSVKPTFDNLDDELGAIYDANNP